MVTGYAAELKFRAIEEPQPGAKLQQIFNQYWPAYRHWFLREGDAARPSYAVALRKLRTHMPELVPTYERIVDLAGGGDVAARFLALYCPPPFLSGCSQAIWTRDCIALVRNYDYPPHRFDGVLLHSAWTGTRVLAITDCLWGVLDGMNEHGLTVSLAFGGRKAIGEGFGITLILRYILELCRTTSEAAAVLRRVPVQMAYNVAMVDRQGTYATAFIAPDRAAIVARTPVSANHQGKVQWRPEHERVWETARRAQILIACLHDPHHTLADLLHQFLQPPVYRLSHHSGWSTLYTAGYYPEAGTMECRWPNATWPQSFDAFTEGERIVRYYEQSYSHCQMD
jgi:predicted choloylglycine hydrolase